MPPVREKRRLDTRDKRRETTSIAKGINSATLLASSSAESLAGRNECPGTHCSMIEEEERENSSCQRLK